MSDKPTDEQILSVLSPGQAMPTYVVKNWLRSGFKGVKTAWVRRQLVRMEQQGLVTRAPEWETGSDHCWRLSTTTSS